MGLRPAARPDGHRGRDDPAGNVLKLLLGQVLKGRQEPPGRDGRGGPFLRIPHHLPLWRRPRNPGNTRAPRLGGARIHHGRLGATAAGRLVTSCSSPGSWKVVPLDGSKRLPCAGICPLTAAGAVFLDGDRSILANSLTFVGSARIEVRDAATGSHIEKTLPYPMGAHVAVSSHDGAFVIVGSGDSTLTVLLHLPDWVPGPSPSPPWRPGPGVSNAQFPRTGGRSPSAPGHRHGSLDSRDGAVLAHLESAQGEAKYSRPGAFAGRHSNWPCGGTTASSPSGTCDPVAHTRSSGRVAWTGRRP